MVTHAYIHIPFCIRKCHYCSFISGFNIERKSEYISALISEIKTKYKNEILKTIYFGGGTPSLLEVEDLKRILSCFNYNKNSEITIEINPETVTKEKLGDIKNIGFNRISLGVQTFDNKTDFYNNVGRGMDVVYKTESGDYVAHRVVNIDEFNDTIQTQSIREGAALDPKISRTDVVGKVTTVIPVVGFFVIMIQQWYFWVILAIVIAAIFIVRALIKEINKDKPITKKKKAKHKK